MKNYRWLYLTILGMAMCLISFALRYIRKKKQDQDHHAVDTERQDNEISFEKELVLKIPAPYRFVFCLAVVVCFLSSALILAVARDDWPCILIIWFFGGIPFLVLLICYSLWKVEAGKDGFRYRNFWGKKREYKFADLEYKMANSCLKWWFLKDGKKVICLAYYIEGENRLLRRYNKYMSKLRAEQRKSKAR